MAPGFASLVAEAAERAAALGLEEGHFGGGVHSGQGEVDEAAGLGSSTPSAPQS